MGRELRPGARNTGRAAGPGLSQVDRDALLHRYAVALDRGWLAVDLACGYVPVGGVVSKRVHGGDGGNDARYDGGNVIGLLGLVGMHTMDFAG